MIKHVGFSLLPILFVVSSTGVAAERFSVSDWKESFARAVSKNDNAKINQLASFKNLEEKAVPACVDCDSKKKMATARDLFDKGQYDAAEKIYNEIPKSSDQWLEAVEERGWTHFRRDNYEKALAQTKTLLSPQFINVVNSEAFFLQSLSQLRICDYEGILTTHRLFKEKQKTRIAEMQNLKKVGVNEALKDSLKKVDKFPLEFADFGEKLAGMPLLFYRDVEFQKQLLRLKVSQAALDVLGNGQKPELQALYTRMKNESSEKLRLRTQKLADLETEKNAKIIQKLNLVEVEAIQRIHTDMKMADSMYKKGEFKKTSDDQLIFMDDGQPWIDELDKYDVAAKSCDKSIRRKM